MQAVLYSLIPMFMAFVGASLAFAFKPKAKLMSAFQHFVAGVIIAAVCLELLPQIFKANNLEIAIGFCIGVVIMIALHELAHFVSHGKNNLPLRLIGASAIDLFIDGIVIGISFIAGKAAGILIALSIVPCAFFLSLTLSGTLNKKKVSILFHILSILVVALTLPVGAFIGFSFVENLSQDIVVPTIAAAVAALLYLAVEEFLVEAHETKDDHFTPLAFFAGFLAVLLFRL